MLQSILRAPQTAADIELGCRLSKAHNDIGPGDIAAALKAGGVKYVLIGGHAINGYTGKPRTTVDVDVIVQHPVKATRIIAATYPHLTVQDTPVVTRFKLGEHEAIDLLKPNTSKLWPKLLGDGRPFKIGGVSVLIPSLEGMLAAKFSAMVSISRRLSDREQDAVDFRRAVEANEIVDLKKCSMLGDCVFPGGGAELVQLVSDARAGKPLKI